MLESGTSSGHRMAKTQEVPIPEISKVPELERAGGLLDQLTRVRDTIKNRLDEKTTMDDTDLFRDFNDHIKALSGLAQLAQEGNATSGDMERYVNEWIRDAERLLQQAG